MIKKQEDQTSLLEDRDFDEYLGFFEPKLGSSINNKSPTNTRSAQTSSNLDSDHRSVNSDADVFT